MAKNGGRLRRQAEQLDRANEREDEALAARIKAEQAKRARPGLVHRVIAAVLFGAAAAAFGMWLAGH